MRHCNAAKFMVAIEEKIGSLSKRCAGAQFDYLIHEIAYVRIGNKLSASKLWWDITIAARLVKHCDAQCVVYCLFPPNYVLLLENSIRPTICFDPTPISAD